MSTFPDGPLPLADFEIRVSPAMAGAKKAIKQGSTFHLSPAMWDLVRHADGDELAKLLAAIPCFEIPIRPRVCDLPMTTRPA